MFAQGSGHNKDLVQNVSINSYLYKYLEDFLDFFKIDFTFFLMNLFL